MIITRTPYRISFFGGGTDYPEWYKDHGGAVLATSINKYIYVTCRYFPPFFKYSFHIRYRLTEKVKTAGEIRHPTVRECLRYYKLKRGVEIQYSGDLPSMTGIGSSSSFTVGMLNALAALKGEMLTKRELALDAIHVEQERVKENVGSQDQTTAAFGGFNVIRFGGKQIFSVYPVVAGPKRLHELERSLMLIFTGFTRVASKIAKKQIREIPNNKRELETMGGMVEEGVKILKGKGNNLDDFGRLLHENWKLKKNLTRNISNAKIDEIYDIALRSGALGGKILGAGGGGFMLLYARPERQKKIRERLKSLLYVPFSFEHLGSQIIYYAPRTGF